VSRRSRALVFLAAALACALLAALLAGRYRSRVEARYGALTPVVVTAVALPAGHAIGPAEVKKSLVVRRVPSTFSPPGALRRPGDALGRAPGATIPAGAYVLDAQLVVPEADPAPTPGAGPGLRPVQVPVRGAEALTVGGAAPEGGRVDVVVSQRAGLGATAKTLVSAEGVRLLALDRPAGPGEEWQATLALTRDQALDLIGAQSGGREIRLLPRP
jgi:Flp pilus assembly protein CpaB